MRTYEVNRRTAETNIMLSLDLDGMGDGTINSGCGFLDHMLTLFARHGHFDLNVTCQGDTQVDYHHSVEDIGICLGQAFLGALGDKVGIKRYADIILPMDEALVLCAVDISGRAHLSWDADMSASAVGDFDVELAEEFFLAFAQNAKITIHVKKISGRNAHHILEACFKALGRIMYAASRIDDNFADEIPSTKGVL